MASELLYARVLGGHIAQLSHLKLGTAKKLIKEVLKEGQSKGKVDEKINGVKKEIVSLIPEDQVLEITKMLHRLVREYKTKKICKTEQQGELFRLAEDIVRILKLYWPVIIEEIFVFSIARHSNGYNLVDLDTYDKPNISRIQLLKLKRYLTRRILERKRESYISFNIDGNKYLAYFINDSYILTKESPGVIVVRLDSTKDSGLSDIQRNFLYAYVYYFLKDIILNILIKRKDRIIAKERLDNLTKLYERGFIEHKIEELLIANERFAVIMLDLDNFKSINDKYGHPKGDEVLEAFSKALRNSIRGNVDFAGRWGGEEFVLLLDLEGVKDWKSLLKEIISRIYINFQEELENIDNIRKIAFSGGVSMGEEVKSYKNPVDKILGIIDLADKRLYKAKRSGKAKVILPDGTEIKLGK